MIEVGPNVEISSEVIGDIDQQMLSLSLCNPQQELHKLKDSWEGYAKQF